MFRIRKSTAELIEGTLPNRPLDHPPGQNYDYSNFGYCVLGRVIEKITRQPYADYARTAVLKRWASRTWRLPATRWRNAARRGKFYGKERKSLRHERPRMDSHGGWIAPPADLVQFFMRVGGFAAPPNILKPTRSRP